MIMPRKGEKWSEEQRLKCTGPNHHNWKGGIKIRSGYIRINQGGDKGFKTLNRIVVEKIIGRDLLKREIVHHIDKDKLNNDPSNLFLFRNQSAHIRWHDFLKRHGLQDMLVSNLTEKVCPS